MANLEVTEILWSFKLVLERKTGKEIPESWRLEFLEKFLVNNYTLLDAEDNISRPSNREGIADLPLLRTLFVICQSPESQVSGKWETVFLAYASLAASKNPFTIIANLSEFYFRFRRSILFVQMRKGLLWVMAAAQAAENHGDEEDLTLYLR